MRPTVLSTGIPSLDSIIDEVMLGDNIVWLVSSPEQYDYFASRFVEHCAESGLPLTYMHFDERIDYSALSSAQDIEAVQIDPLEGPSPIEDVLTEHIAARQSGAHYLFDNLSVLAAAWQDEDAFVEFFRTVCPVLFEVEAVAYFALHKGEQSNAAVARIRDTTQILLDVYEERGLVYLKPIKVWDRYSERMFLPHVLSAGQFIPVEALSPPSDQAAPSEADRLAGYHERTGDDKSLSIREELIRSIISNRPEYLRVARDHFSVRDVVDIKSRIIGSGVIGGKAAGVLLSNRILRAACKREGRQERLGQIREPGSFFVGSGVYFNFLINNNLMHWLDLKYREPAPIRRAFPELQRDFQAGEFPRAIRDGLREIIRAFAGCPIIVRSSSLLEDSYNMAFAGKYESVFLGNQDAPNENLTQLLSAVKTVYASSLGPDALTYRKRQGLLEFQEHMAVLVQKVEGSAYGELFFPPVAGVAFSRNPYPWSDRIDTEAGLARLVFGLGTRAVNRVEADYPRLVALSHPGLHPDGDYMSSVRYHQKHMDAINLAANRLETLSIAESVAPDHPASFYVFSLFRDGFVRAPLSRRMVAEQDGLTVTFQNLLARTDFVELVRYVLQTVEGSYGYPVDIEFTLSVGEGDHVGFCLLQCRPLTQRTEFQPAQAPPDLPPDRVLFTTRKAVSNGELHDVRYVVLIDSRSYDAVASNESRSRLARAVGTVNHHPEVVQGQFVLIGPGRWGSVNIELGVPVTYSEITNAGLLMEMARPRDGYTPEVSYGTHFFQDLVESETFYLPLYPEDPTCAYREEFFEGAENDLARLAPEYADLSDYLKVIDVPANASGLYLHVAMDQEESLGIGYLAPRSEG
ncbi:MAG: PEP/pyruvate-binding domain-containing protein [Planctomycetota bacterium]